jgi:hypothetical protein
MKIERECFAISAGGFHAGVNSLDILLCEPLGQLLKASQSVWKEFMPEFAIEIDETDIELKFGDVDAKHRLCHGGQLLYVESSAARVKLADASSALDERLWILSDLCALRWMPGAFLTD